MRKEKKLHCFLWMLVAGLIFSGGCSHLTPWPNVSGFLGDYKGMYRSEEIEGMFVIKHPEKKISDYSKFLIDPIAIYLAPEADEQNVNKEVLRKVALAFYDELKTGLEKNYTVVKRPGPGVLRIRTAITDISGTAKEDIVGGVIEVEFFDTWLEERIAAALQAKEGHPVSYLAQLIIERLGELSKESRIYKFGR